MKILKCEKAFCMNCMKEHEIKTVEIEEKTSFKGVSFVYPAHYLYCDVSDELYMNEAQIQENDISVKDAYRKEVGLLTSGEIVGIRNKYGITQGDFCTLLGWGGKTITRYESHQVQDKAHDSILRKIDSDPDWFLELLNESKSQIVIESYNKYESNALRLLETAKDYYLIKSIKAGYAEFKGKTQCTGNAELSLEKTVDAIGYFTSVLQVSESYRTKLMELLWYADALAFKERDRAITGLVYYAVSSGAKPVEYDTILNLNSISDVATENGKRDGKQSVVSAGGYFGHLSADDKRILDVIIDKLGKKSAEDILSAIRKEKAYIATKPQNIIYFDLTKELLI